MMARKLRLRALIVFGTAVVLTLTCSSCAERSSPQDALHLSDLASDRDETSPVDGGVSDAHPVTEDGAGMPDMLGVPPDCTRPTSAELATILGPGTWSGMWELCGQSSSSGSVHGTLRFDSFVSTAQRYWYNVSGSMVGDTDFGAKVYMTIDGAIACTQLAADITFTLVSGGTEQKGSGRMSGLLDIKMQRFSGKWTTRTSACLASGVGGWNTNATP